VDAVRVPAGHLLTFGLEQSQALLAIMSVPMPCLLEPADQ